MEDDVAEDLPEFLSCRYWIVGLLAAHLLHCEQCRRTELVRIAYILKSLVDNGRFKEEDYNYIEERFNICYDTHHEESKN